MEVSPALALQQSFLLGTETPIVLRRWQVGTLLGMSRHSEHGDEL